MGYASYTIANAEIITKGGDNYRFLKGIVMTPLEKIPCLRCCGEIIVTRTAAKPGEPYLQDKPVATWQDRFVVPLP